MRVSGPGDHRPLFGLRLFNPPVPFLVLAMTLLLSLSAMSDFEAQDARVMASAQVLLRITSLRMICRRLESCLEKISREDSHRGRLPCRAGVCSTAPPLPPRRSSPRLTATTVSFSRKRLKCFALVESGGAVGAYHARCCRRASRCSLASSLLLPDDAD